MRQLFITGRVTLRQRTLADKYFWAIINRIAEEKEKLKHTPKELADIDSPTRGPSISCSRSCRCTA